PDSSVLSWGADHGTITNGVLDYLYGDLAAAASFSVHVSATTPSGYHNTLNNTATATPTNGDKAEGSASETVLAPSLSVVKTADAATVTSTGPVGFTITVSNSNAAGTGTAYGVVLSDTLPDSAHLTWVVDTANSDPGASISGGVLTDNFG